MHRANALHYRSRNETGVSKLSQATPLVGSRKPGRCVTNGTRNKTIGDIALIQERRRQPSVQHQQIMATSPNR